VPRHCRPPRARQDGVHRQRADPPSRAGRHLDAHRSVRRRSAGRSPHRSDSSSGVGPHRRRDQPPGGVHPPRDDPCPAAGRCHTPGRTGPGSLPSRPTPREAPSSGRRTTRAGHYQTSEPRDRADRHGTGCRHRRRDGWDVRQRDVHSPADHHDQRRTHHARHHDHPHQRRTHHARHHDHPHQRHSHHARHHDHPHQRHSHHARHHDHPHQHRSHHARHHDHRHQRHSHHARHHDHRHQRHSHHARHHDHPHQRHSHHARHHGRRHQRPTRAGRREPNRRRRRPGRDDRHPIPYRRRWHGAATPGGQCVRYARRRSADHPDRAASRDGLRSGPRRRIRRHVSQWCPPAATRAGSSGTRSRSGCRLLTIRTLQAAQQPNLRPLRCARDPPSRLKSRSVIRRRWTALRHASDHCPHPSSHPPRAATAGGPARPGPDGWDRPDARCPPHRSRDGIPPHDHSSCGRHPPSPTNRAVSRPGDRRRRALRRGRRQRHPNVARHPTDQNPSAIRRSKHAHPKKNPAHVEPAPRHLPDPSTVHLRSDLGPLPKNRGRRPAPDRPALRRRGCRCSSDALHPLPASIIPDESSRPLPYRRLPASRADAPDIGNTPAHGTGCVLVDED